MTARRSTKRGGRARQSELAIAPGALALVTGAGSGIGRATALAFARLGAHVLAVDIDHASAEMVAAACSEQGGPAQAFSCDVSDWEAMARLAEQVHAEHGTLDVLVNNAGVGMTGRFADVSIDDWRWIRSINLDGVVHGCRAFGPAMVDRGSGHVVNVASALAFVPRATEPAYVTTKAAVLALSQCLRADWHPRGVGVSAICPGVINTPIATSTRFLGDQDDSEIRARTQKVFRRGHPPDVMAQAIVEAVARDRAVVPVGWEAKLGWWAHRLTPIAFQQVLARGGPTAAEPSRPTSDAEVGASQPSRTAEPVDGGISGPRAREITPGSSSPLREGVPS